MSIAEMEIERDRMYREYVKAIGTPDERRLLKKLDLMDEIMDAQIEHEKELEELEDTATHWDEWMIDNAIDRMREDRMAYEM